MNQRTQMFHTENARFQAERGYGVMVMASDLGDMHVGRGIYRELFRDHEWLCISKVTVGGGGQMTVEYLEAKTIGPNRSTEGGTTTEVTEQRAVKHELTFEAGDHVLISKDPVPRPQGRRVTVVTTRTRSEEPLDD